MRLHAFSVTVKLGGRLLGRDDPAVVERGTARSIGAGPEPPGPEHHEGDDHPETARHDPGEDAVTAPDTPAPLHGELAFGEPGGPAEGGRKLDVRLEQGQQRV